jgi:hypothetical protein
MRLTGIGSQYLMATRDADRGEFIDGSLAVSVVGAPSLNSSVPSLLLSTVSGVVIEVGTAAVALIRHLLLHVPYSADFGAEITQ